jgi:hypothetical protein
LPRINTGELTGDAVRDAVTLSVTARTACCEAVQLQTDIGSVGQQLLLLAILRADGAPNL